MTSGIIFAKTVSRCCRCHCNGLRCHAIGFRARALSVPGCRNGTIMGCARHRVPCAQIVRRGRFRVFNSRIVTYPGAMVDQRCSMRFRRKVRPCCPMGGGQGGQLTSRCRRLTTGRGGILFNNELTRCGCCSVTPVVKRILSVGVR